MIERLIDQDVLRASTALSTLRDRLHNAERGCEPGSSRHETVTAAMRRSLILGHRLSILSNQLMCDGIEAAGRPAHLEGTYAIAVHAREHLHEDKQLLLAEVRTFIGEASTIAHSA